MMRADKVMRLLCWSLHFKFEWGFGRYAVHRNHGVVACAGTQNNIQAVGDYLRADGLFEGKTDRFDPVLNSTERYGVQLNVEKVPVWINSVELEILSSQKVLGPNEYPLYRGYAYNIV
jgi:hypothetical protein